MMSAKEFYITLPSNVALDIFPENATSHFTTPLYRSLELSGDYEAALTEIHYPIISDNVLDGNNEITIFQVDTTVLRKLANNLQEQFDKKIAHLRSTNGRLESFVTTPPIHKRRRRNEDVEEEKEVNSEIVKKSELDAAHYAAQHLFDLLPQNFKPASVEDLIDRSTASIPVGNYKHLTELLVPINRVLQGIARLAVSPEGHTKIYIGGIAPPTSVYLSEGLSAQLGFPPNCDILSCEVSPRPAELFFGVPSQIFVYGDFVQPQIVGNTAAPLLRTVNTSLGVNHSYGLCTQIFTSPYYLPVNKRSFDTVEINLRDKTGAFIPFGGGTSSVVVHFRQVSRS